MLVQRARLELSYKEFFETWHRQHPDAKNDRWCTDQENDPSKRWVKNAREFIREGYPAD